MPAGGSPIPSLEEVFDLVQGKAHLVVELKQPEAAGALRRFFQERRAFEFATVISFWHPAVKALKEAEPRFNTGVLMVGCPADPVGLARAADADALVLHYAYVTPELVAAAHKQRALGLRLEHRRYRHAETLPDHEPGRHRQQPAGGFDRISESSEQ